jgi:hypothetical protein
MRSRHPVIGSSYAAGRRVVTEESECTSRAKSARALSGEWREVIGFAGISRL